MRSIVYVAGPFRSYKNISEEENRIRAEKVGKLCQKLGSAPIVPHSSIFNGVYGDEAIEEEREAGIETTLEITEFIAKDKDSEIWVIANKRFRSGSVKLSEGTAQEVALWTSIKLGLGYNINVKIKTYEEWLKEMELK